MIEKISKWIRFAENVYLTVMVLFSVLISVTGVFFRYVLNNSLSWVEEVAGFVIVGVITVGASVAIREKKHIKVEILLQFFPSRTKIFNYIAKLTAFSVMIMLFVLSIKFVYGLLVSGQKAMALNQLYIGLPLIVMPAGYLIGCFRFFESLLKDFNKGA